MTKKEMFEHIKATYPTNESTYDEVMEFCDHQIDLLSRKNENGEKKPTAVQLANESYKALILETMEDDKAYTVTELVALMDDKVLTQNKITALMRQLVESSLVVRTEEKRKAYFTKVTE